MTNEEIRAVVGEAIKDGLSEIMANRDLFCRYAINPAKHDEEHAALRKFINVMSRIEDMKWGVLQKVIIAVIGLGFTLMVYGMLAKLTIFGGWGWPGK